MFVENKTIKTIECKGDGSLFTVAGRKFPRRHRISNANSSIVSVDIGSALCQVAILAERGAPGFPDKCDAKTIWKKIKKEFPGQAGMV